MTGDGKMKNLAGILVVIGALAAPPALAGELADAGSKAEQQVGGGQFLEALDTLNSAIGKVWEQAPLTVRKALFVSGDPPGFGLYTPRPDSVFKASEVLVVYAEPVGYGFGKEGDQFVIDLAVDVELKNKAGQVLGAKADFGQLKLVSHAQNHEFMAKLSYNFSGLPAGEYEVVTTLRDATSGKKGSFSLAFTIVP
jgi:hypothetical protein